MARNHLETTLIGNLGRDPEKRLTPTGKSVTSFTVAVNDKYAAADGQKKEETVWLKLTAWGPLADVCDKYLKKGSKVFVAGRLKPLHLWDGQDGEKHGDIELVINEIEFLSAAPGAPEGPQESGPASAPDPDDLPF